jgi:cis-3-alkyl-4-acyloxetan-2-one decarboxylase
MPFLRQAFADLYPFESHWLELPSGERLHFVDEGPRSGPVLLFVHGNPTWSFHWRRLITRFSDTHRCIAVDHIGCGLSDKPPRDLRLADHIDNLKRLVQHLGIARYSLVAQDWGGAIGLGMATAEPECVDRVVLFNTAAFPPFYVPRRIGICRVPVLGKIGVQGLNMFARAAMTMTLARRQKLEPRVAAAYLAPYDTWNNRRQIRAFVDDIPRHESHPTWQVLADIEAKLKELADHPSLLIWGMRDWCFRPECLVRFEQAWPTAQVHRLADVGHWVVEDADDEVAELMSQFLAPSTAPATTRGHQ